MRAVACCYYNSSANNIQEYWLFVILVTVESDSIVCSKATNCCLFCRYFLLCLPSLCWIKLMCLPAPAPSWAQVGEWHRSSHLKKVWGGGFIHKMLNYSFNNGCSRFRRASNVAIMFVRRQYNRWRLCFPRFYTSKIFAVYRPVSLFWFKSRNPTAQNILLLYLSLIVACAYFFGDSQALDDAQCGINHFLSGGLSAVSKHSHKQPPQCVI